MSKNTKGFQNEETANEDDPYYITLNLDDGSVVECLVVGFFEADGRDYIALLPVDSADTEEGEVYLYRYSEADDETPILDLIETDEEYEIVSDAFDEFLDSIEYDEIVDDFDDFEE